MFNFLRTAWRSAMAWLPFGWKTGADVSIGSVDVETYEPEPRPVTKFDHYVEMANRIPRPLMVYMILAMFAWSVWWSGGDFDKWLTVIAKIPSDLWLAIFTIIGLVWGIKKISTDIVEARKNLMGAAQESVETASPTGARQKLDENASMLVDSSPLGDNPSLAEWDRVKAMRSEG